MFFEGIEGSFYGEALKVNDFKKIGNIFLYTNYGH